MSNHGITVDNLMSAFPLALQEDRDIVALATSISEKLVERVNEIGCVLIYPKIDELPDQLLDALAYDFKIDWWDCNFSLQEKRETLKRSWHVYKHMGTKSAVFTAISAIYPQAKVEEWFEYGGSPYHFRVSLGAEESVFDYEKIFRAMSKVEYYKNARSAFDAFKFLVQRDMQVYFGTAAHFVAIDTMSVPPISIDTDWYIDENDEPLLDGDGTLILV